MGVTFYIGGSGRFGHRHSHEVKTPKGKRNFCIIAAIFLSFFLAVLTLALTLVIKDVAASNGFHYECEELVGTSATTYEIVVDGKTPKSAPTKFVAKFELLDDDADMWVKEITVFETEKDDGETKYTFSVVFPKNEWLKISHLSSVHMYFGEEKIKVTDQDAEGLTIAIIVIGIFIAVLTGLIVFNIVSAVKYAKQAKEEALNPAGMAAGTGSNNNLETTRPQAPDQKIKCPYCGTYNSGSNVQCDNCKAPLM